MAVTIIVLRSPTLPLANAKDVFVLPSNKTVPFVAGTSVVADAGASQGAAPAPEPVVAESAPEPAPAPETVVDDAPPPAPESDIV